MAIRGLRQPICYNNFPIHCPPWSGRSIMVKRLLFGCIAVWSVPLGLASGGPAEPFQLKDGDRVVLVGNTLIEREQRYGYWETLLTSRYPDRTITFRNLGWSGDTVFGEAQARFGSVADGFRHLKNHVLALKP